MSFSLQFLSILICLLGVPFLQGEWRKAECLRLHPSTLALIKGIVMKSRKFSHFAAGRVQSRGGHANAFLATWNNCAQDSIRSTHSAFFISSPFQFYPLKSWISPRTGKFLAHHQYLGCWGIGVSLILLHYCP